MSDVLLVNTKTPRSHQSSLLFCFLASVAVEHLSFVFLFLLFFIVVGGEKRQLERPPTVLAVHDPGDSHDGAHMAPGTGELRSRSMLCASYGRPDFLKCCCVVISDEPLRV